VAPEADMTRRAVFAALLLCAPAIACRGGTATPKLEAPGENAAQARADAGGGLVPNLRVVLDDPRLAAARERERARDFSTAARAVDDARRAATLSTEDDCAWQYVAARLHVAAGELADGAAGFDRVAESSEAGTSRCPLAPYARLRAAQAYAKLGDFKAAEDRARGVQEEIALSDEARLALADALAGENDAAHATPLWRASLAQSPRTWIDVNLRLAAALLDGAEGPPPDRAAEALELATRVVVESPKVAESSGANAARKRALDLLAQKDPTLSYDLSNESRARQAKAWLDAGESSKAVSLANAVIASLDTSLRKLPKNAGQAGAIHALACTVSITRAQATGHTRNGIAADAWGDAITACAGNDALVTALYSGGKASTGKRPDEAVTRFAKVEQLFPAHRLADDARLQGALIHLDQGDEARFTSMLLALPDDYPQGDMRGEALFRVALFRMTRGDWAGAGPLLDRIVQLFPDDRHWATQARAAYFRARVAAATGDADDARQRYLRIIDGYPLAFYMTEAYARVAQGDLALARRTLDAAVAREEPGELVTRAHDELARPAFVRGTRLLEVGEIEAARRELGSIVGDSTDTEVLWTLALLYNRASAPEVGHAFARAKLTEYVAHYPAGRWRAMWEIAYPRAFETIVAKESAAHGIPTPLTWAIMREESDFYPEAKSAANAYGLMQLIVPTARGVAAGTGLPATEEGLKRPEVSIALGTKLLAGLRAQYDANPSLAIAAYNGGAGAVNRWLDARGNADFDLWVEQIPWDETRGYIKRVIATEAAYALLYDRAALSEVLGIPIRAVGTANARVNAAGDGGSD
jgi:soluble lytic murein transglycosylase